MWIYLLYVSLMMDHVGLIKLTAADQGDIAKGTVHANEHSVITYFPSYLCKPVWLSSIVGELNFCVEFLEGFRLLRTAAYSCRHVRMFTIHPVNSGCWPVNRILEGFVGNQYGWWNDNHYPHAWHVHHSSTEVYGLRLYLQSWELC